MKLYNSMTDQKQELIVKDNTIRIYACGPTVYNYFHIGNGRSFIIFDMLQRYLKFRGYNVIFVQNFTDVDDKMIKKANEMNVSVKEVADKFIDEYFTDAHGLGIEKSSIHPRATENIEQIIEMIKILIEKNHAYVSQGDVYFRVRSFKDYGKLFKQSIDELEVGARIDANEIKEDMLDFALWKNAKDGEISWESPWGSGRPGWHIECSVMAKHYLGDTIDIHCGGGDLRFPHHENEIAQSECANGCEFARFWFHAGFVNVNSEKMSKSKNNFFTVRDLAGVYGYDALRFFALSAHYRNPINFAPEIIEQAQQSLSRLYNCVENLNFLEKNAENEDFINDENDILAKKSNEFKQKFIKEMDDDLNTANAISVLFEYIREINILTQNNQCSKKFLHDLNDSLSELLAIMGFSVKKENISSDEIDNLIEQRQTARKNKDFALADKIRDQLKNMGVILEDTANGIKWKMK